MQNRNKSEIAQLREQIALEYEAYSTGLTGLSATASHAFITARQENLARHFETLLDLMPLEEAMKVFDQAGPGCEEKKRRK